MPCGSPAGCEKQDAPAKSSGSQHLVKPATTTAGEPWTDLSDIVSGSFWTWISIELLYDFVELLTCSCHSFDLLRPFELENCCMLDCSALNGDESKVARTKTLQGQWASSAGCCPMISHVSQDWVRFKPEWNCAGSQSSGDNTPKVEGKAGVT